MDQILNFPTDLDTQGWKQALASVGASLTTQDALAGKLTTAHTPEARIAFLGVKEDQPEKGKIWVSTIHAAKGLEWDAVWLAGLDEDAFKAKRPEDQCLAFVGVTRARSWLEMTYAKSRQSHHRLTGLKRTDIDLWIANPTAG